ncbi:DEKNAAC103186 [Brettanomyces naardenensis]|uniref:DEKNAAC103186 n=1 Tax=Brettanomyces naardenensis TaxID=13370 RepID=A0A448YMS1_BRENA|nr:DEKNAAC103186 [Brettanomyces naardenensis]
MGFISILQNALTESGLLTKQQDNHSSDDETPAVFETIGDHEKILDGNSEGNEVNDLAGDEDDLERDDELQHGVKDIETVTSVSTKASLIWLFIAMWLVYLLNAFQTATAGNLVPYVTSDCGDHSLLTVIDVVANSLTAAVFIPLAKFLDLWGRAEGFLVMAVFSELGLILMATSKDLPTFCAANVSEKLDIFNQGTINTNQKLQ